MSKLVMLLLVAASLVMSLVMAKPQVLVDPYGYYAAAPAYVAPAYTATAPLAYSYPYAYTYSYPYAYY